MKNNDTVKLGLMPPLTGLVGIYGPEISWAGKVACQEINEAGGVLGRPLELIIEDDGSLPESAVAAAKKLVDKHHCSAIIGNLLSNSRISVAYRIAETRKVPYLNFSFYEGSIMSRYFFHFAALPNQQIDKMIPFMMNRYGGSMFFAGNNYEWPRGSIDAAKKALLISGGTILGEEYLPIGTPMEEIEELLDKLEASAADVFVPYFAGNDQVNLLTKFTERGLKKKMAVVMGHYDEMMASQLPPEVREGFYSSNTYFMKVNTEENCRYMGRLAALPDVTGIWPDGNGILTNFGEGTYLCVKAFAEAANKAGSLDTEQLLNTLRDITLYGPQGRVEMNREIQHAKVNAYLSRCTREGTFEIVEEFGAIDPIMPERYRHMKISKKTSTEDDLRLHIKMMESMNEGIVLAKLETGNIIYVSPGFENMFGYNRTEIIEKPLSCLIAPSEDQSPEEHAEKIRNMLRKKGHWEGEVKNIRKDGSTFWVDTNVTIFTHAEYGEVLMKVLRDTTERRLAEREAREFKSLADVMFDAVFIFDTETLKFTYTNKAAQNQVGYSSKELSGMTPTDIKPQYDDKSFLDLTASLTKKPFSTANFETIHRHKNGNLIPVEIALQYIAPKDENPRFTAVVRDITERKRYEESLRVSKEEAEKANASKSTFLATMSHEIRTPLNSIIGLSEVLMESKLDGEQKRLMHTVSSAGENLLFLINDILDISRIESGSFILDKSPFLVADQIEDCISIVSIKAKEKGIDLKWNMKDCVPEEVMGDSPRLRQVLINLLSNAIKFTEVGTVSLNVDCIKNNKGKRLILFSISDEGIGIEKNKQELIFEPFKQSDSSITRRFGGTGLGLAISKKIVEMMGGEMCLESEIGKGSTFYFTADLTEQKIRNTKKIFEGLKVLTFNSSKDFNKRVKKIFSDEGALVKEVSSTKEVLKIISETSEDPFNMVIGCCDAELESGCLLGEKIRAIQGITQPAILLCVEGTICKKIERGIAAGIRCGMLLPGQKKDLIREAIAAMEEAGKIEEVENKAKDAMDILLVDDSKDNRMLIKTFLKKTNHRIMSAENGLEAIKCFKDNSFDLVLMDIQMPEMDGYTATMKIRKWESSQGKKQTPIVALTAHAFTEDMWKSSHAGCTEHVTKPIKKAKLLDLVAKYTTK